MEDLYREFGQSVKERLIKDVNGYIKYEAYPDIDVVLFRINFKDFEFNYGVNKVSEHIYYHSSSEDVVDIIKKQYKKAIMNAFFKNEEHKKRDQRSKIGI